MFRSYKTSYNFVQRNREFLLPHCSKTPEKGAFYAFSGCTNMREIDLTSRMSAVRIRHRPP